MAVSNKLRDLFIIRKGGGKTELETGKRYVLNKSGSLVTIDSADTATFDQYAEDPNALLMLGDRGDLRQIETITRNLSVLFNRMVDVNELYDVTPNAMSAQVVNNASYSVGGLAYCDKVKFKGTAGDTVTFQLMGSNDNAAWEPIGAPYRHTFSESNKLEEVVADDTAPKYSHFKIVQGEADAQEEGDNASAITGAVFLLKEKAVSKFFPKSETDALEALVASDYDLSLFVDGSPLPDQNLYMFVAPQALYIKQNFDGFVCNAGTNPSAPYPIKILLNDEEIGTMTLGTTGGVTLSPLTRKSVNPSDWLRLQAPSEADPALKDLAITLNFERETTQ